MSEFDAAATATTNAGTKTGATMKVVPLRHPGRWVTAVVLLALVGLMLTSVITNRRFEWNVVGRYLFNTHILDGIALTLVLTVACMAIGIVLGTLLAVMRLSANPVARAVAGAYVGFFRGTPVLVQLLFWFNISALYPVISFGIPGFALNANTIITPIVAAILGLGLNEAAYTSEIVRAGIISVDHGQVEAARALGLTRGQTLVRVVLPQAMAVIVPPTGNEVVGMLKTTSLVSVLAVGELLYSAQLIYSANFQTIPLLLVASIWYLILTAVFSAGQYWVERHYARGRMVVPPPLPGATLLRRFVVARGRDERTAA